jgi:Fic family protein
LRIELISEEAAKTSEIEGKILNRDNVQSSLRHQFGLGPEGTHIPAAELGIASMMTNLYERFADPLDVAILFIWHDRLMSGEKFIKTIGAYRTRSEPMQVVSGPIHKQTVHFERPPSKVVSAEMQRFIAWYNDTARLGKIPLPALTRACLVHLYFECVHPFEDGNSRIGRVDFCIAKAKFYERMRDQHNDRQSKVIARIFKVGIDGFEGGLPAENYISITGTSRATATRDLQSLVEKSAFTKAGYLRHTRYFLKFETSAKS